MPTGAFRSKASRTRSPASPRCTAAQRSAPSSSGYVGLVPQRLAEQHGGALGLRWFAVPAEPAVDVRLLRHARLDADPAQRRLREMIRAALDRG
ncbi:type 2 periplasmic-binding domain-containing protein [Actinacidiphila yanglinensis]|nr:hypothetical protein [Actinacidiphila yanglinensis]